MKKNKFIIPILFIISFLSFNSKIKALDVSGLGDGSVSPGSSEYCNDTQGCKHNEEGVRITIVDKDGKIISGTHSVDYWTTIPSGSPNALPGSTYRSAYINSYGNISFNLSGSYNTQTSTNTSAIGGISWSNQHELIENILKQIKFDRDNPESCVNPAIFEEAGYDICAEAVEPDCKPTLFKTYILIEPLFHINMKKHDLIVTGTEFTFLIDKQRQIDKNRVYNLSGDAGYGTAFAGMYITQLNSDDDIDYAFNANGKKYVRLTETRALRYDGYYEWVHTAAYGANTEHYPLGNSMHLVWLGDSADELCTEPKKCCVPCEPNDQACIEAAGDNWHSDDPYCCYEDDKISEDGTVEACVPADEYWETRQDYYEQVCSKCCIPSESNNFCCDSSNTVICEGSERKSWFEYWADKQDLYEEYCQPKTTCGLKNIEPEVIVGYCDLFPINNISYFRDGVFNSENGQFAGYTIEDMEKEIKSNHGSLPIEWLNKMATEFQDNTFLALAYLNDSRYTTKINDYCSMHCQEVFEVQLPSEFPSVNSGRYFKWTIMDSENDIAKVTAAKLCAVDIDLDKAIDNYQLYSLAAKSSAAGLANLTCNNKWGVKPVIDGQFAGCDDYATEVENHCAGDYVCLAVKQEGKCCMRTAQRCTTNSKGQVSCTSYCAEEAAQFVCAHPLYGAEARHWYAFVGGTHYEPTCGDPGVRNHESAISVCGKKYDEYMENVTGYGPKTGEIYKQVTECKKFGEIMIDMNLELEYQTLFNTHTYSTPDDIEKTKGANFWGSGWACIDNQDRCNTDDIFTMSDRSDKDEISCETSQTLWVPGQEEDYVPICFEGTVDPVEPNYDLGNYYFNNNVTMLNVTKFGRCYGFVSDGEPYNFSETFSWNTIYASYISESDSYQLNEKINACICKDGEVRDKEEDGSCSCVREVSYKSFIESYNNYQELPDGTLSVEFMNGSGFYPIGLKYWTLGTLDENGQGHFDTIVTDLGIEECSDGVCIYGDPYGYCRFIVKNRIIAEPDDDGICEDPPCDDDDDGDCEDPPCTPDPGDFGECIIGGKPNPDCGDVSGLNVIYRVIDLDNPFPGPDGNARVPGDNWNGKESIITENRGTSGMGVYSLEPLYSATLTPAAIKEIRKDNHENMDGDYLKGTLVYPSNLPGVYGGGYSLFVHEELESIAVSYGGDFSIKITNDDRFSDILKTR